MQNASLRSLALLLLAAPFAAQAKAPVVDAYGTAQVQQVAGGAQPATPAAQTPLSAQGELFLQLQQLHNEVARLRGLVEEQQYQIRQLTEQGLERYKELDARLETLRSQSVLAPVMTPESSSAAPAAAEAAAAEPAAESDPEKEKLLYDASFDLIKARDFEKADLAFSAFLRKYPQSQYASNAQYWLGEVKLAQGQVDAAGEAFSILVKQYPQSAKVPDALYKLAEVERRQGNVEQARQVLQQVISQYPKSSAAKLAQSELARL